MPAAPHGTAARWLEFDEIDSTNAEAMRLALAGERGPLYIRADRQSAGRGRSRRAWATDGGNLALSRMSTSSCAPDRVPQLSLVAGVAVHRALRDILAHTGLDTALALKWPNDLLAGRAKLAGILIEATTVGAQRVVVIGIGVNLATAPALPDRETAALAGLGVSWARDATAAASLARSIACELEACIAAWDDGRGFDAIRAAWLAASVPLGTAMAVHAGASGRVSGRFAGLDDNGYLLFDRGDGSCCVVTAGDVALIGG